MAVFGPAWGQEPGWAADGRGQCIPCSNLYAYGSKTPKGIFFLCYFAFCRKPLFPHPAEGEERKSQEGNLNFTKSLAVLTEPGICRELLPSDGPPGCGCELSVTSVTLSLALLWHWLHSTCPDQIFCTSSLWI